ncbi:hypothetical protein BGZ80_009123, partial [Entomortierella chlamydospora]
MTPSRIVARHVLRWDALTHNDITHTVFDTDNRHHDRHRHHHRRQSSYRSYHVGMNGPGVHSDKDKSKPTLEPSNSLRMERILEDGPECDGDEMWPLREPRKDAMGLNQDNQMGQPEGPPQEIPGSKEGFMVGSRRLSFDAGMDAGTGP